jgi:carbamoyltransferase
MPWTLGLGGSDHDFSAALMQGSDVRIAIEEERLSRRKYAPARWYENPHERSVRYCLENNQVDLRDVEAIVGADTLPARVRHEYYRGRIRLFPHHLCHAASAYMMLPVGAKAGIIVYDGYGSIQDAGNRDAISSQRETFSFFSFGPKGYERIGGTTGASLFESDDFPKAVTNSIGMLYELVTSLLGYEEMEAGKTMGLSSHGIPKYVDLLEKFVEYGTSASSCFRCDTSNSRLVTTIQEILRLGENSFDVRANLAASIQEVTNRALLNCVRFLPDAEVDYICISGGCALNCVATSLLSRSQLSTPILAPAHCGDAGLAFGALWLYAQERIGIAPRITMRGQENPVYFSRPGRRYSTLERREAINAAYPNLVLDRSIRSANELALELTKGSIVALFNGASEFGPRALGGRSILADPRSVLFRERINREIKHREPYRPLAPIVLAEHFRRYFEDESCVDYYMQKVSRVTALCERVAPAVVHVDQTARVQVVCEDTDPFLADLLRSFDKITDVGLLINTSFNQRGEPIVESPHDAIQAFLNMGLDGLFIDGDFFRPYRATNRHTS